MLLSPTAKSNSKSSTNGSPQVENRTLSVSALRTRERGFVLTPTEPRSLLSVEHEEEEHKVIVIDDDEEDVMEEDVPPVPTNEEVGADNSYFDDNEMHDDSQQQQEEQFIAEIMLETKGELAASLTMTPHSSEEESTPNVALTATEPPPASMNFYGRPRRMMPPVPDYYGIAEEQAARIDLEFDKAWAWAMEAAAPATAAALAIESDKRNRDRSLSSPLSDSRKPSAKSPSVSPMVVVPEEPPQVEEVKVSKRKSRATFENSNTFDGASQTTSGLSLPDIPQPQTILGEMIEAEIAYSAHLDRLTKSLVPLLQAKLNSDDLAGPLMRLAALHRALLKAMTFTSEEEEDDQSLIRRVTSALQILSSRQFKRTYVDFARHSKRLHLSLRWLSQGSESSTRKGSVVRTQTMKRVNVPVTKLFRKGVTSGEDLCKPIRHLSNLKEALTLLVQSCEIYKCEEQDKLQKLVQSLEEVTSDASWKAQDDLLQTNYLLEAERQLRLNNIELKGHIDEPREIVRDGRVFKASLVLKRLVPTRIVLFNDLMMWLNDETLEFMGFLVLSEDIRVSTDPMHPCQFQILTDDVKSSKTKAIRFQCKREEAKSMWVYHIQRILTLRLNQKSRNLDSFDEKNAPMPPEETFSNSMIRFTNTNKSPKDLILLEKLGKGAFGEVYKAFDRVTQLEVAVKVIFVRSESGQASVMREIETHQKCKHHNIVQFMRCFGPDELNRYWMVLAFCQLGSLFSISRLIKSPFTESEAKYICNCMLNALDYLHKNGIIHRDIKGKNILMNKKGEIFLADFGISVFYSPDSETPLAEEESRIVGTPHFLSPECIMHLALTPKADIWSLGITMFELVLGYPPHSELPPLEVMQKIQDSDSPTLPKQQDFSTGFQDFLSQCLIKDFKERPSAEELLSHPWFSDLIEKDGERIMQDVISRCQEQEESVKKIQASVTKKYESTSGAVLVTTEEEHEQEKTPKADFNGRESSLKQKFMAALSDAKLLPPPEMDAFEKKQSSKSIARVLKKAHSAQNVKADSPGFHSPPPDAAQGKTVKRKVMPWDDSLSSESVSRQQ